MFKSRSRLDSPSQNMLRGARAGFIGTAPMTLSMLAGWLLLPAREKYPLPPQQITTKFAKLLRVKHHINTKQRDVAALLLHFGYGTIAGSVYGLFENKFPLEDRFKGGLAGLILWAGSYLGWLPIFGILRPATQHPWRRNVLMILAHLVWGVTMGEAHRKLTSNIQMMGFGKEL